MSDMGKLYLAQKVRLKKIPPVLVYIAAICSDTPDYHFQWLLV